MYMIYINLQTEMIKTNIYAQMLNPQNKSIMQHKNFCMTTSVFRIMRWQKYLPAFQTNEELLILLAINRISWTHKFLQGTLERQKLFKWVGN